MNHYTKYVREYASSKMLLNGNDYLSHVLKTLKSQLCLCNLSALEQRMLWSTFTLSFYWFLHASECLSLTWSNVILTDTHVLIELCQSKTNLFWRRQSIHIYPTTLSACPVCALWLFANRIKYKLPQLHVFNAGKSSPLSCLKLTRTICHLLSQAGMYSSSYATQLLNWCSHHSCSRTTGQVMLIWYTYVCCLNSVIASVPRTLSSETVTGYPTWNPDNYVTIQYICT